MAVVAINYVKKGSRERATAKGNIKYIENRKKEDKTRTRRELFGASGPMTRQQGYDMVTQAPAGSTFFRVKISPDPQTEDIQRDLLLREITRITMDIEERMGKRVSWIAAIHDDHTDKRHVHVLAVVRARKLPAIAMIQEATKACKDQRLELDQTRALEAQKEQGKEDVREKEKIRSK